jgi:peptidoglycan L-alanyl-D-glutamate endopeptidase CwlK
MSKYSFGKGSQEKLMQLRRELRRICYAILDKEIVDFGLVYSYRDEQEQNKAYKSGASQLEFPNSKHNTLPSDAVDIQTYIAGKGYSTDTRHAIFLAGLFMSTAIELGYKDKVRWGGNWDMDGEIMTDQKFQDLMHFEWIGD